jgi:prepilin-type N-terminal cleavage/methylation domain-containing protein
MKGFTLLELLAVMIIAAVLLAVAVPKFNSELIWRTKAYTAARKVASCLLYTQSLAISTSKDHRIDFLPSEGPFVKFEIWKEFEGGWVKVEEGDLPEDVTITGDYQFTFHPLGDPTSGGEISVVKGEHEYTVEVDPIIGRVEVIEG